LQVSALRLRQDHAKLRGKSGGRNSAITEFNLMKAQEVVF